MKIYLASAYGRREEMLANASLVEAAGHHVTSRVSTDRIDRKRAGWVDPKKRPKGPNGRPLCRFCDQEIQDTKRRTFCSEECVTQHRVRTDPGFVRDEVFRRDQGVCAACGFDTRTIDADDEEAPDEGFIDSDGHYRNKWGAIPAIVRAATRSEAKRSIGTTVYATSAQRGTRMKTTMPATTTIDLDALAMELEAAGYRVAIEVIEYLNERRLFSAGAVVSPGGHTWTDYGQVIDWTALDIIRRHVSPVLDLHTKLLAIFGEHTHVHHAGQDNVPIPELNHWAAANAILELLGYPAVERPARAVGVELRDEVPF